ncbi:MAG: hemK [Thermoleophilia bacterium]|nr:hemK [Thermoleophilia bacterium]
MNLDVTGSDVRSVMVGLTAAIRAAGIGDSARLDAELLLGKVTGLGRVQLRVQDELELTDAQLAELQQLAERRLAGEPVAYLLGTAWFYGREFAVDHRVLIPRPETEGLVELALEYLDLRSVRGLEAAPRVIDACTGSGCVAVTVALERAGAEVFATDISEDALEVAHANAAALGARVELRAGDLLDPVAEVGPVDVIVANPPYVEGIDAAGLEGAVRDHEPHVALFVPNDEEVAAFYGRLAAEAMALLAPGGLLAVEHGQGQRELVRAAFAAAGFGSIDVRDDLAGIDRIVLGLRPVEVA